MITYEKIRKTTFRGAKVKKLLKFLKNYNLLFGEPQFPITDATTDEAQITELELQHHAVYTSTKSVRRLIKATFDMGNSSEFKKKIFTGSKMVSVLQNLDFMIFDLDKRCQDLSEYKGPKISSNNASVILRNHWRWQLETLTKIRNWLLLEFSVIAEGQNDLEDILILQSLTTDYEDED